MHPITLTSPVYGAAGVSDRSAENPAVPLSQALFDDADNGLFGPKTASGVRVTRRKALGYSAVWRAVNLISRKLGSMPLKVYNRSAGGKRVDAAHPAHRLLHRRPNEHMTPVIFKQTLQSHALLRGNGYALIVRDADARPVELLPLNPEKTWPFRRGGVLWYMTEVPSSDGKGYHPRRLLSTDVLHVRGLGFDGLIGYDVISLLREAIGKAIATHARSSRYFANDSKPSIALEFPDGMNPATIDAVVNRWQRMGQGIENAHKVAILRDGVKLNQYSANARDSQMLENLQFDSVDIANVFGLPPRKLGLDVGGGYNSIYEENQSIHDDVMDPWYTTWEEECNLKLLTEAEQEVESHYTLFVRNALMRANPEVRSAFYNSAINGGWMSRDEVRETEDLNPIPGGAGQAFLVPVNMAPAAAPPPVFPPPPAPAPAPEPDPQQNADPKPGAELRAALRPAVADVARRMARRIAVHADKAARRGDVGAWAMQDLSDHAGPITEAFGPIAGAARAVRHDAPSAPWLADQLVSQARRNLTSPGIDVTAWGTAFERWAADGIPLLLLPE